MRDELRPFDDVPMDQWADKARRELAEDDPFRRIALSVDDSED